MSEQQPIQRTPPVKESGDQALNELEQPIQPTEADVVAATLEWSKHHCKTPGQMQQLTVEETADCYRLAQAYTLMRLMRSISSEGEEATL